MLFNICIFGIFLFLMLWEACPRYLLCILPIMIASASNGLNNIMKLIIFKEDKIFRMISIYKFTQGLNSLSKFFFIFI